MHAGVLRTREKRTRPQLNGGTEKDLTAIENGAEMKLITSGRREKLEMGGGGGVFPSAFLFPFCLRFPLLFSLPFPSPQP